MTHPRIVSERRLGAATKAVYIAFGGCGFLVASWFSRLPEVRSHLGLSPGQLGLVLLSIAIGATISRPLTGPVVVRIGERSTVIGAATVAGGGLFCIGLSDLLGAPLLILGLLGIGLAAAAWDVAMNVQAVTVEKRLRRSILPRFHAVYAAGALAGAGIGLAAVAIKVPIAVHLGLVAFLTSTVVSRSTRNFLTAHKVRTDRPREPACASVAEALRVWTERKSLQIGLYVFAFALAEGAATDWIGVAIVDGHEVSPKWGTLGFAMFLASLTTTRWLGGGLLSRYGRVTVLRGLSGVAIVGVLLFVFGPSLPTALAGVLLWGVGIALGYPVGISAGGENSDKAAARVSTISTIGKVANFAGPPLIGLLGSHNTVRYALLLLVPLQCVALAFAGALRSRSADT